MRWRRTSRLLGMVFGIAFTGATLVAADAAPHVTTQLTAAKRIVTLDADGAPVETFESFSKILPGEEVAYWVDFQNARETVATDVVVKLPVPAEMSLVAGSAEQAGVEVTYSVDGGRTFGLLADLMITETTGAVRAARAEDVNALKWTLTSPLAAGASGRVGFRAVLK